MPELPEVETVVRGLNQRIISEVISDIEFDWPKTIKNNPDYFVKILHGCQIESVSRRAKIIIIKLRKSNDSFYLLFHLKMTGQIVIRDDSDKKSESWGAGHPDDNLVGGLPSKATRLTITFISGKKLFFNDVRKFGWVHLLTEDEFSYNSKLNNLGPEPLEPSFTYKIFKSQLDLRPRTKIKSALLDQALIAGIGNIYADESLFMAKIHPFSIINQIPTSKLKLLHQSIISILNKSIELGGSSSANYINVDGKKGSYLKFASVYKRENLNCKDCTIATISRIKLGSRSCHVCLNCQILHI